MKKYLLSFGLLAACFTTAPAQKVLLAQDVTKDTVEVKFGPNKKYFGHMYVGYGFVAGPAENKGSAVDYGSSHEWLFGYRFKYKVGNVYALGFDVTVNPVTYFIKQKTGKTLPNPFLFDEEKFKFTNFGLSVYQRFNWDKRGNYVGNFIDMGAYGNWMPVKVHIFEDDNLFGISGPLSGVKEVKVRETGLKYVEDFNYGVLARVGFNRYVFYGSYRLSDLFGGYSVADETGKNMYDFAELPRVTVGFQLGLHK